MSALRPSKRILARALCCIVGVQALVFGVASANSEDARHSAGRLGKVLLNYDQNNAVCIAAFNGTTFDPKMTTEPAAIERQAYMGHPEGLAPGSLMMISCSRGELGTGSKMIVAFDLRGQRVAWTLPLTGLDTYTSTYRNVLFFSHRSVPASDFKSGYTERFLSAYSTTSGKLEWKVSLGRVGQLDVLYEGPSGVPGHPTDIILTGELNTKYGTAALDSATGKLLWHHVNTTYLRSAVEGYYVSYGIAQKDATSNSQSGVMGVDARTGKDVWTLTLKIRCGDSGEHNRRFFSGSDMVTIGEINFPNEFCVEVHNLLTGKVKQDVALPRTWKAIAASASLICEYDGHRLSLYALSNLQKPIWSIAAGPTTPIAVVGSHVLVKAPSGLLLLDAKTGAIVAHVTAPSFESPGYAFVSDGLIESAGTSDNFATVLDVDAP
jgi:PQQ-like domain